MQRALELYESHCEPDSEKVANALCELAQLYTMMKKYRYKPHPQATPTIHAHITCQLTLNDDLYFFSAAECFYDQALEIYVHLYDECSDQSIEVRHTYVHVGI